MRVNRFAEIRSGFLFVFAGGRAPGHSYINIKDTPFHYNKLFRFCQGFVVRFIGQFPVYNIDNEREVIDMYEFFKIVFYVVCTTPVVIGVLFLLHDVIDSLYGIDEKISKIFSKKG